MFYISSQNLFPASKVHIEIKIKVEWTGYYLKNGYKTLIKIESRKEKDGALCG